eukprot:7137006-Alexandrium_andersonii.AAC.1
MAALNQGDEGRNGQVRFLFGALMARPSNDDAEDPRTPNSALRRCISINWAKACSGHTSLPWSSDE